MIVLVMAKTACVFLFCLFFSFRVFYFDYIFIFYLFYSFFSLFFYKDDADYGVGNDVGQNKHTWYKKMV